MSPPSSPHSQPPAPKRHLFDDPAVVKRLLWVFFAICLVLLALDVVVHRHVLHPWEALFGFYPAYGFAACVVLVLVAKEMRKLLMRAEDYYDPPKAPEKSVDTGDSTSPPAEGADHAR